MLLLHRCDWGTPALRGLHYYWESLPLHSFTHLLARRFCCGLWIIPAISRYTGNPTLCGTVSYYIGVRTITNAITRPHLARSYSKIGQKHFITNTIHLSDGLGVAHIKCHTTYKSESIVLVWTPGTVTLRLTPSKIRGFINKKPPGDGGRCKSWTYSWSS